MAQPTVPSLQIKWIVNKCHSYSDRLSLLPLPLKYYHPETAVVSAGNQSCLVHVCLSVDACPPLSPGRTMVLWDIPHIYSHETDWKLDVEAVMPSLAPIVGRCRLWSGHVADAVVGGPRATNGQR